MTDYPVFRDPPIVEALLDIQVVPSPDVSLDSLKDTNITVIDRYPNSKTRQQWEVSEFTEEAEEPTISGGKAGYIFLPESNPPDKVFQANLKGYTFSKLKPYDTWIPFRDEAKELWGVYTGTARPASIKRLGLRTINSLNLPLPFDDFKEYILTTPEVAPGLPAGLSQFFMQLGIPQPGGEMAIVTSAMDSQQKDPAFVRVFFDIDVYVEEAFPIDSVAIWDRFEKLRVIRNDIFFSSLTQKAMRLF